MNTRPNLKTKTNTKMTISPKGIDKIQIFCDYWSSKIHSGD